MKPGPVAEDRALLRALEEEIPILEEKLRAMKATRTRLRSKFRMIENRKNKAFREKTREAIQKHRAKPEERERWATVLASRRLCFPRGTPERSFYEALRRKGWTRSEAIAKVQTETRPPLIERLPFSKGTPERYRYRALLNKGWTRELAIKKVHAEGA